MKKDSKIYIAGHRGMVGSAIHRKLTEEGYDNLCFATSTELDLRDKSMVDIFFYEHEPELYCCFKN
jgi:GDP-L-fucose synthase